MARQPQGKGASQRLACFRVRSGPHTDIKTSPKSLAARHALGPKVNRTIETDVHSKCISNRVIKFWLEESKAKKKTFKRSQAKSQSNEITPEV